MLGNRQNLTIIILGVVGLGIVVSIALRQSHRQASQSKLKIAENIQTPTEALPNNRKDPKYFLQSLELMVQCLKFPNSKIVAATPPIVESIIQILQGPMGPVSGTSDRWLEWSLLLPNKHEKKYRLEITETDEGIIGRELHAFVGSLNTWAPEEVPEELSRNPSDQVIENLLKEGEVTSKSKAGVTLFPNGSRLEFIEVNGELEQIEIFDEDNQFGCKDIRSPESCICN